MACRLILHHYLSLRDAGGFSVDLAVPKRQSIKNSSDLTPIIGSRRWLQEVEHPPCATPSHPLGPRRLASPWKCFFYTCSARSVSLSALNDALGRMKSAACCHLAGTLFEPSLSSSLVASPKLRPVWNKGSSSRSVREARFIVGTPQVYPD
ncbi:hypothetical protein O9929_20465 [Vibrio lentus]|nr:hypothetical protein [Vibrio lentus]